MQWQIDTSHSSVTAAVKHMMLTTVRGAFSGTSGVIDGIVGEACERVVIVR